MQFIKYNLYLTPEIIEGARQLAPPAGMKPAEYIRKVLHDHVTLKIKERDNELRTNHGRSDASQDGGDNAPHPGYED